MKEYLEAGKIINTHGVRGEIKLDAWSDNPGVYKKVKRFYLSDKGDSELVVKNYRGADFPIVSFEGIDSLDDALRLKGKILYVHRNEISLPEGKMFIADLIGLPVFDSETNEEIGTIVDIYNRGASDIYEIEKKSGGRALVPGIPQFILERDIEKGVKIKVIEGLLD